MNSKLIIPLALVAGGGLVGCGSSSSSGSHVSRHGLGHPLRSYHVTLTGSAVVSPTKTAKPAGAPHGSGAAAIALHRRGVVCFRFAHLSGFSSPTTAQIGKAPKGKAGPPVLELSRAHSLHHKACVRASRALGAGLEKTPSDYYLLINSKQYPQGAVRGQL